MAEGTVNARGQSKAGKPTITIDSKLYYGGNTDLAGLAVGDRISFTCTSFADGKLWGIDKGWKLISAAPKYPSSTPSQGPIAAPAPPAPAPNRVSGATPGITEAERILAYGVVTEAIKAGLIKEPEQVEKWLCAAKNALRSQGE